MKYLDCVEIIVEKEKYANEGVHKGMQGVIWLEESINGEWDVYFPGYGENPDLINKNIISAQLLRQDFRAARETLGENVIRCCCSRCKYPKRQYFRVQCPNEAI